MNGTHPPDLASRHGPSSSFPACPAFSILAGKTGFFPLTKAEAQHTIGRSWAAFDLLPSDPAKTPDAPPLVFDSNRNASSPLVDHTWIPAGPDHPKMVEWARRSDRNFSRRSRRLEPGGARFLRFNVTIAWNGGAQGAADEL